MKNENREFYSFSMNYELINGNRLKFEDLFVKDADTQTVLRKIFYNKNNDPERYDVDIDSVYFDKVNNCWVKRYYSYDER